MNAQNSDSFPPEVPNLLPEVGETPSIKAKEYKGAMAILSGFWHKKLPNVLPKSETVISPAAITEVVAAAVGISDIPPGEENPVPVIEKSQISTMEKISHIFHKNEPMQKVEEATEKAIPECIDTKISEDIPPKEPEKPVVIDERFTRILENDSTYHTMFRSEDIKNIQLQLSMRYMIVMLAIFVVIVWVVNNRVIMFGFSDFPVLARARDALFVMLTGLFSLTVWFGAAAWFHYYILVFILRSMGCLLFFAVLVSTYLPFWR